MSNLRRKFKSRFEEKQNVSYTISGLLGNSLGIAKVPNRANYVYVRLAGSGVAEVFNNRVTAIYDLPVICGYDPVDPRRFQVLSIQGAITEAVGSSLDFGSGYAPANRYRWLYPGGGQDPLMVEGRQFMPLRITPTSGLKFRVESQIIWDGTGWKTFGGSTETDLTSLVPTTDGKCCMVLITIDEDGIIATTKGNEVDIANLVVTDIPIPPAGTLMVLGSIRLYYGQTAIQEARTNTDIADGRFSGWDEGVGSPSWNDITGKPTEFPPEAHTHVGADILDLSVYLGNIGDIPVNMISPSAGDLLVINSGSAESLFDPDNLVKDGSVSPANLFDGNKTNQWVSTEAKNWAAFDFEYSAYVSKIVITANAGDWMWADFPNDIYIWGSHTGTFTGEETEMDHYAPTSTGVYTREFSEPRTAYRYYKIDFGRPSHGCRVNELEIYVVSAPTRFENRKLVEADITDLDHDAVKIDGITVDLTGISDGEALVYDSTGTKIIPGSGGGGASAMSGLSDVDLTGLADDDILVYNSISSKWLPEAKPTGGGGSLTVEETDGTPSVASVIKIKVTNGTLTDDGSGVVSLDFGSVATDGSAIHDNEANEISAITEKTTPADDDLLLIEDSAASYVKKSIKISNLPGSINPFISIENPPKTGWSWLNQKSATVDESKDYIVLNNPTTSDEFSGRIRAVPSAPYKLTVGMIGTGLQINRHRFGLWLYESGSGKLVIFYNGIDRYDIRGEKWNSVSSFNAGYFNILANSIFPFLQIEDNGTNRMLRVSNDGVNFIQLNSIGRTDFITPDYIGICSDCGTATAPIIINLFHWLVE